MFSKLLSLDDFIPLQTYIEIDIIVQKTTWLTVNHAEASASAVLVLDYIQTLPTEMAVLWSKNILSGTSILFVINRYGFLAWWAMSLYGEMPGTASDHSCHIIANLQAVLSIITVASTSSLIALRVYSIYNQSRNVLFISVSLILTRAALDIYEAVLEVITSTTGSIFAGLSRCGVYYPSDINTLQTFTAIVLPLTFDTIMLLLTFRKMYSHVGEMRRLGQTTISRIILRDGILYYTGIFLVAAASGSLRIIGVDNPNLFGRVFAGVLTPFFSLIPNLLVNRLFLNLRSYQSPSYGLSSSDTALPVPVFAQNRPNRFLGNIGEPLDYDQLDDVLDGSVDDGAAENKPEFNDVRDPLTTLVPVVYDSEGAGTENIEMVFMQRDTMPSAGPYRAIEAT